jgi:regulator of RNase E activity RraB
MEEEEYIECTTGGKKAPQHKQRRKKPKRGQQHAQSQAVAQLLSTIEAYERDLKAWGVYYDYPSNEQLFEEDSQARPVVKYRAMHTRGNTKNQKKNIKRQQMVILRATADHLRGIWERAKIEHEGIQTYNFEKDFKDKDEEDIIGDEDIS